MSYIMYPEGVLGAKEKISVQSYLFGHRIKPQQTCYEYLSEFLQVALAPKRLADTNNTEFCTDYFLISEETARHAIEYRPVSNMGLKRFVFFNNSRLDTKAAVDRKAYQQCVEILSSCMETENVSSVEKKDMISILQNILYGFSIENAGRSWFNKNLLPICPEVLFPESLARKRLRTNIDVEQKSYEIDSEFDFKSYTYMARGGEVYYLHLLHAINYSDPSKKELLERQINRLLQSIPQLSEISNFIQQEWVKGMEFDESDMKKSVVQKTMGAIPLDYAYRDKYTLSEMTNYLDNRIQPMEKINILSEGIVLQLFRLMTTTAARNSNSAGSAWLIDVCNKNRREYDEIRKLSSRCFKMNEESILKYIDIGIEHYLDEKIEEKEKDKKRNNAEKDTTKLIRKLIHFDSFIPNEKDRQDYQSSCQFPMVFIPDTIAQTHGLQRKINISQMQFLVSRAYTQLVNKVINPNAMNDEYKVMQVLELQRKQNALLDIAHQKCRWVVCEDRAIDRELLQNDERRIIGFTTGEGCFGEYNITVSAREDLLLDIKEMLKQKLIGKFNYWSIERTEKAAEHCIELTESFDGSRILKALNPYDYEIHNFLAYALTVKILHLNEEHSDKCVLRSLINLDSYVHWFRKTNIRPDFMLIEIPVDDSLFSAGKELNINIKIIECKMSLNIDNYFEEAIDQVESGLRLFSEYWDKNNNKTNRRYWFTQLYRAIAFSVLQIADNDPHYSVVSSKIYNILNGNINISWSGEIFAFDLRDQSDTIQEKTIISEIGDYPVLCQKYGQIAIQKLLMPCNDGEPVLGIDVTADIDEMEKIGVYSNDEELSTETAITELTDYVTKPENITDNVETIKRDISDIRILLGKDIKTSEKIYWEFGNPGLNNRHLLINGNSGCGKTYCIQGLLMSTCLQGVSSIVFDYTGGFTEDKLDTVFLQSLGERIKSRFVYVEGIPVNPFKKGVIKVGNKNYPEKDVIVAQRISEILKNVYAFGSQQTSSVYQAVMTCFKRSGENMTFGDVCEELSVMKADTVVSKIKPFIDLEPFVQGEVFDWTQIRDADESVVYIFQFDGYPRDVQVLLTEILLWDIWNFCVKTGSEDKPLVLVMDEAQNLSHKEKSPSAKILTEGRKFGISGWYATQFMKPQLSDDEIQRLQQSGQKLYFCPPDDGVDTVAKNLDTTSQGKAEWSAKLKKLKKGECVSSGNMVLRGAVQKYPPKIIKVLSLQERTENE